MWNTPRYKLAGSVFKGVGTTARAERFNRFVEWTHNGSLRGRHSSAVSAPLRSIHGQR